MGRHFATTTSNSIFKRDNYKCIYCGAGAEQVDHVIPASKGGPAKRNNGVCVCRKCNYLKRDKLNMIMITRGIYWLMQKGEDMSWVDKLYTEEG